MKSAITPNDEPEIKNNLSGSTNKKIICSLSVINNLCTWKKTYTTADFGIGFSFKDGNLLIKEYINYDQTDFQTIAIFSSSNFSISDIIRIYKNY